VLLDAISGTVCAREKQIKRVGEKEGDSVQCERRKEDSSVFTGKCFFKVSCEYKEFFFHFTEQTNGVIFN